jgi:hypothetical protein
MREGRRRTAKRIFAAAMLVSTNILFRLTPYEVGQ